jgi:hypothetical protein
MPAQRRRVRTWAVPPRASLQRPSTSPALAPRPRRPPSPLSHHPHPHPHPSHPCRPRTCVWPVVPPAMLRTHADLPAPAQYYGGAPQQQGEQHAGAAEASWRAAAHRIAGSRRSRRWEGSAARMDGESRAGSPAKVRRARGEPLQQSTPHPSFRAGRTAARTAPRCQTSACWPQLLCMWLRDGTWRAGGCILACQGSTQQQHARALTQDARQAATRSRAEHTRSRAATPSRAATRSRAEHTRSRAATT